ncbi:hypothetical protein Q8A73_003829 [Channa argus]|nr:hypothetical protein Q8A73_003829 [Channa argus]
MDEVDDVPFSLMSLEDELTCSICLSTFDCPDSPTNRKRVVEYQHSGQTKLRGLMKKFVENIDNMSKAKEDIPKLLSQSKSVAFLQILVSTNHIDVMLNYNKSVCTGAQRRSGATGRQSHGMSRNRQLSQDYVTRLYVSKAAAVRSCFV